MNILRKCKVCGIEAHTKEELKVFVTNNSLRHGKDNKCKACDNKRRSEAKLQEKYGITIEDYHNLLIKQNYCCAICGTKETDYNWRRFAVDHNHETGEIRGLLCDKCNTSLGGFKDSVDLLKNAINYLNERGTYDRTKN